MNGDKRKLSALGARIEREENRLVYIAVVAGFALGLVVYPVTVVLALISAPLTLAVHGLLAGYYAFNQVAIPRARST